MPQSINTGSKSLIVVVGPTAIGKTSMAIAIAKQFNCEIVSCDSRQFFCEMSIGTAVPSAEELAEVQHHFIHNKSIFETYTVGDFEKEAIAKLADLFTTNDFAVLVGGSGLYVDAVLTGFDAFPATDPDIRESLTTQYENHGIEMLQTKLHQLDPVYYAQVELSNPQRIMRALEVCISSGQPYSSFLNRVENKRNFNSVVIGIEAPREIIYDRINRRVDQMVEMGLIEEARRLYPHRELNALQTVGYRELFACFDGDSSLEFTVSEIKKNTRRFAKRQLTWFKRNAATKWFNYTNQVTEVIDYIKSKL